MTGNAIFIGRIGAATIAEFQAWERRASCRMAARQQIIPLGVAFELRAADVLARTGRRMALDGDAELAVRILEAIDGRSSYADVLAAIPEPQRTHAASVCHSLLGSVIDVPAVVEELERRVSLAQLVRFPQQSPYTVPRAYWENSIAVRAALPLLYEGAASAEGFAEALCGLHRLATLGVDGRNFYGTANATPTVPGEFRHGPVCTWVTRPVLRTMTGWLRTLGVSEPVIAQGGAAADGASSIDLRDDGLTCTHLGNAESIRAALEDARQPLLVALRARTLSARDTLIAACARVHQVLVTAHPFTNVNNSIAMNIVNGLLSTGGVGVVPHFFLDHLAPRMTPAAYASAFAGVVSRCAADVEVEESRGRSIARAAELLRLLTLAHWPSVSAAGGSVRGSADLV